MYHKYKNEGTLSVLVLKHPPPIKLATRKRALQIQRYSFVSFIWNYTAELVGVVWKGNETQTGERDRKREEK